jgi:glycosyltransferase involved in cell wall biosynthesis
MPDRQAARDIRRLARCPRLRMTVPTRACRDALVKTVAPEASVSVLPPAARPIDRQAGRRQRTRGLLGLGNRQRLIVAPGEVMRDGAHKMAVWVFAILRELRDDLRLLLPETGPALPNVRSFAEATGHESETYMAEGRAELADCLAAADVAVLFPRQGADAYALTAAMAAGLPIAASGTADVSEIAPHGEAALLAPPGDPRSASAAVLKLLEDADLSARLSMEARRIAGQFHPRQVRGQLEGIYAALRATAGA